MTAFVVVDDAADGEVVSDDDEDDVVDYNEANAVVADDDDVVAADEVELEIRVPCEGTDGWLGMGRGEDERVGSLGCESSLQGRRGMGDVGDDGENNRDSEADQHIVVAER